MAQNYSSDFLKHIEIGTRALLMYSENHPSALQAVNQAFDQMSSALTARNELEIKIEDGQLMIEGQPTEKGHPVLERLMHELLARNIYNLTFFKGISREELVLLMHKLNLKPQRIMDLGGFEEVLKSAAIEHVQANRSFDPYDEAYISPPVIEVHEHHEAIAPETSKVLEELSAREKLSEEDLRRVVDAIADGIRDQKHTEVDSLTKKVFHSLANGSSEEKIAATRCLPGMLATLSTSDRSKNAELSAVFVVSRCYRKETNREVLGGLQAFLLNAFEKNFVARNFQVSEELLTTIRSQTSSGEATAAMMTQHAVKMKERLLEEIAKRSEGAEAALQCIKLCDRNGVSLIFDRLTEEEDRTARSNLINYMEQLDSAHVLAEIESRLVDSRWYVVRNMITILGRLKLSSCPAFLKIAAQNPEARVSKEIIKTLHKTGWRPDPSLIAQLLQHPDKSVRLQAVHLAHRLEIQATAPHVIAVARSASESDLRTACLQALLHWKVQDAIPLAETILQKPNAGRADLTERNTAVMILGEMKRQDAHSLLEKIAASDPNPETRNVARSYL